mmetsp:Transcript_13453/g.19449  ORF Transcript_13453/g.19449 Transcript_13453/m.19449 type:complete len:226 (+) Transcript_13453:3217-3894(+)
MTSVTCPTATAIRRVATIPWLVIGMAAIAAAARAFHQRSTIAESTDTLASTRRARTQPATVRSASAPGSAMAIVTFTATTTLMPAAGTRATAARTRAPAALSTAQIAESPASTRPPTTTRTKAALHSSSPLLQTATAMGTVWKTERTTPKCAGGTAVTAAKAHAWTPICLPAATILLSAWIPTQPTTHRGPAWLSFSSTLATAFARPIPHTTSTRATGMAVTAAS